MANFLVAVDPDRERRSRFLETITPLIPPVPGLVTQSCAAGDFAAVWAAHPTAPVSWQVLPTGAAAILWGEAIAERTAKRIQATELPHLWGDQPNDQVPLFDGFYAALLYDPIHGLIVGADLLGMFPIYYHVTAHVVLVASSPELFRYHPLFRPRFNPSGLVGILLTNGLFEGATLWRDVHRLGPGNILVCGGRATRPREVNRYRLPGFDLAATRPTMSLPDQLSLLDQTIDRALDRHVSQEHRHVLLLSGGLDSRMLAGYLTRHRVPLTTLTLGIATDIEMQCAALVWRTLKLDHHPLNILPAQYGAHIQQMVDWEHLASGFNNVMNWAIASHLGPLAPRVITGHSLDSLLSFSFGGDDLVLKSGAQLSYTLAFQRGINNWGLAPSVLERLCRPEVFGTLVQDICHDIQARYESYAESETSRMWLFEMYHRQRFHIGSAAWQLSFGAWPVLLALDRTLLEIPGQLPPESLASRYAQKALLCREFPDLARLPLDRNDFYTYPLLPTRTRQRLARLRIFGLQLRWRRLERRMGYERRYYHRIYDLNNPGWRLVREEAETQRPKVDALFDLAAFSSLLPAPHVRVRFPHDPIVEASGLKALLGFLIWSKERL